MLTRYVHNAKLQDSRALWENDERVRRLRRLGSESKDIRVGVVRLQKWRYFLCSVRPFEFQVPGQACRSHHDWRVGVFSVYLNLGLRDVAKDVI